MTEGEKELQAVKFWLKYLFLVTRPSTGIRSDDIRSAIHGFKNQPPDDYPDLAPAEYDRLALELLPALERVGIEIALYLEQFGPPPNPGSGKKQP